MKIYVLIAVACLSACTWFGSRKQELPDPTELIVTGAPQGSIVFVDGSKAGADAPAGDLPQVLNVSAGAHQIEVHLGGKVVYREDLDVGLGEHRVVTILSGASP